MSKFIAVSYPRAGAVSVHLGLAAFPNRPTTGRSLRCRPSNIFLCLPHRLLSLALDLPARIPGYRAGNIVRLPLDLLNLSRRNVFASHLVPFIRDTLHIGKPRADGPFLPLVDPIPKPKSPPNRHPDPRGH